MEDSTPALLEAALDAVRRAAAVARSVQRDLSAIQRLTKTDASPVSVADFAVQAIVAMALRRAEPAARITGEEHSRDLRPKKGSDPFSGFRAAVVQAVRQAHPEAGEDDVLAAIDAASHDPEKGSDPFSAFWALDPIDGTKGFLRGGQYAIALARIERGRVTMAVLGCPNLSPNHHDNPSQAAAAGVICHATAEGGASESPIDHATAVARPLRLSRDGLPDPIRVCRSVESGHFSPGATARVLEALGRRHVALRLDSQCKYAVLARGQADLYLRMPTSAEYRESVWDHAAGALLAAGAGAVVTDIDGRALDFGRGRRLERNRGIVAAHPAIHGAVIDAIHAASHEPEKGVDPLNEKGSDPFSGSSATRVPEADRR
jgi:HAL2 family 3'(2'),5'-bisphosphate nucleotidase